MIAAGAFAVLSLAVSTAEGGGSGPSPKPQTGLAAGGQIIDADRSGAVIRLRDSIVGVDAGGRVVWRDREASKAGARAVCIAACPDAILSGSLESLNDPDVADPPLRVHLGEELSVVEHPELKRRVIWARSPGDTVAVTGDAERLRLEFASPSATTFSGPIEDVGTFMHTNPSQTRGATFSLAGASVTLRWLERRQGSWRQRGMPLEGADACASFDLEQALILRRQALLVGFGDSSGKKVKIDREVPRALPTGCNVSRNGFLLSQVDPSSRSVRGIVSFIGNDGRLRWQRSFERQAFGLALGARGVAAVLAGEKLSVIDATGRVVASREVGDARQIGPQELAVLTSSGELARVRLPDLELLPLRPNDRLALGA